MKFPVGIITGQQVDTIFNDSINYHVNSFHEFLSEFEPLKLFVNWRRFIQTIDEIINIPLELESDIDSTKFLELDFSFLGTKNENLKEVIEIVRRQFGNSVAERFTEITLMSSAIDFAYQLNGIYDIQGSGLNLSTTINSIEYFQSRRAYYVTLLALIPQIAKGSKNINYIDILNNFQYPLDSCLVGITTSYYTLLVNQCLSDYKMISDGEVAKGNFDFVHLEGFFTEPERLSLLDQLELREEAVIYKSLLPKSEKKVFSFSEVADTMNLFEGAFTRYKIENNIEFRELGLLLCDIGVFLQRDFDFVIDQTSFEEISSKYKSLTLIKETSDYFTALNSYAPFQRQAGNYYSTVVLLTRFVYRTLSSSLLRNKTFQIHSGFVFEDRVSKILSEQGFTVTNITRINHKEFDLITTKGTKIYNFQCKNNYIDISIVGYDYKKIGRFNQRLCKYYEKALLKEVARQNLITEKLGIQDIEHYVISRFPVITRNFKIINFRNLENYLQKL